MPVQLVQHQVGVPKETKDAIDFIADIVDHFKQGKSAAELTALIPGLVAAVTGAQDIDDEFKSEHKEAILAYLVHRLGGLFI